jgi:4,4'-diaponeurosporenoate glycosyltransferase
MWINICVITAGLIISRLLFCHFPALEKSSNAKRSYKISVIIPARNEEKNLSLLLEDLKKQIYPAYEIICVDDCSMDKTAEVASSFGVKLIRIDNKPGDWTGKAWACQKGGEASSGDLFLFLDADVRLRPDAISCLVGTYEKNQCVISVQPYHETGKNYEQFSLFFNLIQIAANGTSTSIHFKNPGLYGPVILIDKETYRTIKGHTAAKSSIVDDLALGEKLTQNGFLFKLYIGGQNISFCMYGGGFLDLMHGWTKNYATGALKTPLLLFGMVFLWVASCISAFICLIQAIFMQNSLLILIFLMLYALWVLELFRISRKIGRFKEYALIFYPIYMALFMWVFILSFIKKLFHLNVVWKGRKIKLGK